MFLQIPYKLKEITVLRYPSPFNQQKKPIKHKNSDQNPKLIMLTQKKNDIKIQDYFAYLKKFSENAK